MGRARGLGRTVAIAVLAAAALGISGLPAHAAPRGPVDRPAPVDPSGQRAGARAHARTAPTHKVPNDLLNEVLAEDTEDDGGEAADLSALCQSFIGKPNPYHRLAPNVDAIHDDGTNTVGTQAGCSTAQNETTIAVNPYNPRNLVAGSNDYRLFNSREQRNDASGFAYTTFDGGRTWKDVVLPKLTFQTGATGQLTIMDSAGDPAIAFGPNNTVYYANLVFSRATVPAGDQAASGLTVSVSHDGGLTWGDPSIVQLDGVAPDGSHVPTTIFNDKEWIGVDPIGGTAYVTWTRFTFNAAGAYLESPIMSTRSTDRGRTWSTPVRVTPSLTGFPGGITPFAQGSNPAVTPDGALHVAYETAVCATVACDQADDHDAVVVATSRDGGRTFRNTEVGLDFDFPRNADVGRATLTGENFRINSYPQLTVDRLTGRLWVTWADDRNGQYNGPTSVKTNGDAFLASSANGRDWSPTLTLGTPQDEVFPAVAALAGRVAVTYYTRHYDPAGIKLDYAFQAGWGRFVTHGHVRRITTESSDPSIQFVAAGLVTGKELQGVFIGDYTAVAMGVDFQLHPCWTDFRGNPGVTKPNQDVVTQSISVFAGD
ncbi:MAG: neuraminidase [Actinobacteria bacterium 13_2_20CM_2_72_6]|nr:MAG: neuraminidase [Actinobacteria bacterium 13_2_20CM_2_72_6]